MRALLTLILGWLLCAAVMLTPAAAQTGKRVALVIGNSDYKHTTQLPNPRNDAEDLSKALKRLGFEVVEGRDLDWRGMKTNLEKFARLAQGADAALAFYAGHGLQHQGENYLVPVDAKLEDEIGLDFQTVRVDDIVRALDRARGVKLLILDACRNLPLAGGKDSSNVFPSKGLAKIGRRGMVVAYATQADDVAYDGSGRNSFFTGALVNTIEEPGLEVGQLFRKVAATVSQQTGGKQTPELSLSLTGEFYFSRGETDRHIWQRVRGSSDKAALQDFLARFPTSDFADAARAQIEVLDMRAQAEARRRQIAEAAGQQKAEGERLARGRDEEQKGKAAEEVASRKAEEERAAETARLARQREEEQRREELAAQQRAEQERLAWARLEEEQKRRAEEAARERAEQERLAWARLEEEQKRRIAEQAARQRAEQERLALARADEEARGRAEQERVARLRQEEEIRQRAEQERVARAREEEGRQKSEQERLARARQEEETRQRVEQERIARAREEEGRQKAEQERLARVRQEQEAARQRIELARREEERLKAEQERLARVRQEEEAARQRIELARREEERLKAEQERVAAARLEQRRGEEAAAREKAEQAERERIAQAASRPAADGSAQAEPTPAEKPIVMAERRIPEFGGATPEAKPEPVDTPELVEKAQKELSRIGCHVGKVDGMLGPTTRDALARYYEQLRKPGSPPHITAGLVEELEERKGRLCPLECEAGERAEGNTCVAVREEPQPRRKARPGRSAPEREPVAERSRPQPERPIIRRAPAAAPPEPRTARRPDPPPPSPAPAQPARPRFNAHGMGF